MNFKTAPALAIALLVAVPPSPSAQSRVISLASVSHDGMLVPFAVYDGRSWVTPWPEPSEDLVADLESLPTFWKKNRLRVPTVWQLWSRETPAPVNINALTRERFEAGCQMQAGLLSDFRHEPEETRRIASHGPVTLEYPTDLREAKDGAPAWKDIVDGILKAFPASENDAIAAWKKKGQPFEVSLEKLKAQPIQLRTLYAHREGQRRVVYFEGVREYETHLSEPGCNARTYFSGWAISDNGAPPIITGGRAIITDCDEMEAARAIPLAIIRGAGSGIWLLNNRYYESDAFSIMRVGTTVRRLLRTLGGGC